MQTDRGIYHKRVCDRCGAVLGGRMMNPDEYFKDWAWRRDTGDLCPECYAEYNGLRKTKIRQGSCAVIAMRETIETATTIARIVVL